MTGPSGKRSPRSGSCASSRVPARGRLFYPPVVPGDAVALATPPAAFAGAVARRRLEPLRTIDFALFWRDRTPAPALERFIGAARSRADGEPARRLGRELVRV